MYSPAVGTGNQVINPIAPVTNVTTNANIHILLHGVLDDEDEDEDYDLDSESEYESNSDSGASNISNAEVCFTCFTCFRLIIFLQMASMLPSRTIAKKSDKDPEHPPRRVAAQAAKNIIAPVKQKKNARQKGKRKAPEPSDVNVPSPTAKRLCASVEDIEDQAEDQQRSQSPAAMLEPIQSAINTVGLSAIMMLGVLLIHVYCTAYFEWPKENKPNLSFFRDQCCQCKESTW